MPVPTVGQSVTVARASAGAARRAIGWTVVGVQSAWARDGGAERSRGRSEKQTRVSFAHKCTLKKPVYRRGNWTAGLLSRGWQTYRRRRAATMLRRCFGRSHRAPNTMASGWRDLPTCVPVVTQSASAWHALHEADADRLGTTRSRRSLGCEITWDPCEVAGWAFEIGKKRRVTGECGATSAAYRTLGTSSRRRPEPAFPLFDPQRRLFEEPPLNSAADARPRCRRRRPRTRSRRDRRSCPRSSCSPGRRRAMLRPGTSPCATMSPV